MSINITKFIRGLFGSSQTTDDNKTLSLKRTKEHQKKNSYRIVYGKYLNIDDLVEYIPSKKGETEAFLDFSLLSKVMVKYLKKNKGIYNVLPSDFEFTLIPINETSYLKWGNCAVELLVVDITHKNNDYLSDIVINTNLEGYCEPECTIDKYSYKDEKIKLFTIKSNLGSGFGLDSDLYPVSLVFDSFRPSLYDDIAWADNLPAKPVSLHWQVKTGDHVDEGQYICSINSPFGNFKAFSKKEGIIGIDRDDYVPCGENGDDRSGISPTDKFYTIYKDTDSFLSYRFFNSLELEMDEFTSSKAIKWDKVAGRYAQEEFLIGFDFFEMDDNKERKLYIVPSYFDNSLKLIIGCNRQDFNLSLNDTLLLLLEHNFVQDKKHIITFVLSERYYRKCSDIVDVAFSTPLTTQDLNTLSSAKWSCVKWRIASSSNCTNFVEGFNESSWTPKEIAPKIFHKIFFDFKSFLIKNSISYESVNSDYKLPDQNTNIRIEEICYVYLMVDTTNGFYKIGMSNNPQYRESTLQSEKPTIELICAKQYPSRQIAASIESALHKTYESKHIRGEWFSLSSDDVNILKVTLS